MEENQNPQAVPAEGNETQAPAAPAEDQNATQENEGASEAPANNDGGEENTGM